MVALSGSEVRSAVLGSAKSNVRWYCAPQAYALELVLQMMLLRTCGLCVNLA